MADTRLEDVQRMKQDMVCSSMPVCTRVLTADTFRQLENRDSFDNFERWNALIEAVQHIDGGLMRHSAPAAIAFARATFDDFVRKYPLMFAFWTKYAEMEKRIAGQEAAETVRPLIEPLKPRNRH